MTATNHAVTGAIIGFLVSEPLLAAPIAFLSHFVCDSLPHYASAADTEDYLASNHFKRLLIFDATCCVILVIILASLHPRHWLIASLCAFLATSPDLFWINHFRLIKAGKTWHPNLYSRFAAKIQWYQRPSGAILEAGWFITGVIVLSHVA
jgi:hypothetical protein